MAISIKNTVAVSLGAIVSSSLAAASRSKAQVAATKEAEFQKAVADGSMSYGAQLAFREQQLREEKASVAPNAEYIAQLEKSVAESKRLDRFQRYRNKYQKSFAELRGGRETAMEHLEILQQQLNSTNDPELKQEIQNNIISAEAEVKQMKDNILANQIKKAQYDGTPAILESTISKIKDRKALATLNGDEEEASALDATLSVLNQQVNKVNIENATDKLQVTSIAKGLGPLEKVKAMNELIASSNNSAPVTIDGKTFGSVAEYWTNTRDSYLSGDGKGIFSDFFNELGKNYDDKINAAVARDGYATTLTMDAIKMDADVIRSRPEFAPFVEKLDNLRSLALGQAFRTTAQAIVERATYTGEFKTADTALQDYSTRYGVDASGYRLSLGNQLTAQIQRVASQTGLSPDEVQRREGLQDVLPSTDFAVPTPTTDGLDTTGAPTAPASNARVFTQKETQDLQAAQERIKTGTGNATDKANVDTAIRQGWKAEVAPVAPPPPATPGITPPPAPVTPAPVTPAPAPTTPNRATPTPPAPIPPVSPTLPVSRQSSTFENPTTPTPTPTSAPVTPKPAVGGGSIVDYLKTKNQDTSFSARAKMAQESGIQNYTGTAEQNTALLKKLQGM